MGEKKPPKNVEKLIADHTKKPKDHPTVSKRIRLLGGKSKKKGK